MLYIDFNKREIAQKTDWILKFLMKCPQELFYTTMIGYWDIGYCYFRFVVCMEKNQFFFYKASFVLELKQTTLWKAELMVLDFLQFSKSLVLNYPAELIL